MCHVYGGIAFIAGVKGQSVFDMPNRNCGLLPTDNVDGEETF